MTKRPHEDFGDEGWSPPYDSERSPSRAPANDVYAQDDSFTTRTCWRCEKTAVPIDGRCRYCRARVESSVTDRIVLREAQGTNPILKIVYVLAGLMLTSLALHWLVRVRVEQWQWQDDWSQKILIWTLYAEGVATALVALGFWWTGRLRGFAPLPGYWRLVAWLWAWPGLAVLLGLNFAYAWLLKEYLHLPRLDLPFTPLAVVVVCVVPAVVEEFFFRYVAINAVGQHVGLHGTVWITSVMFGMAYIGNPLGMPFLILLGAGLGYARVCSGSLLLPMLLHFLHNAVVLYVSSVL